MLEISLNPGSVSENAGDLASMSFLQHLGDQLVFGALRASLGWSGSFLRRGDLVLFTADGAHRSLRRYLLAIGDAGMAGVT